MLSACLTSNSCRPKLPLVATCGMALTPCRPLLLTRCLSLHYSRGGTAKQVAKELTAKGFGKVYVVSGGFDGSGGWVQSKLQIKPTLIKAEGILGGTFKSSSMKSLPSPKSA